MRTNDLEQAKAILETRLPKDCGGYHEWREIGHVRAQLPMVADTPLCSQTVRMNNGLCAHNDPELLPLTYTDVVDTLVRVGVIDAPTADEIRDALSDVATELTRTDTSIRAAAFDSRDRSEFLSKTEHEKRWQKHFIGPRLETIRRRLLEIVSDALPHAADTRRSSDA